MTRLQSLCRCTNMVELRLNDNLLDRVDGVGASAQLKELNVR
jgi:hypothetical protein